MSAVDMRDRREIIAGAATGESMTETAMRTPRSPLRRAGGRALALLLWALALALLACQAVIWLQPEMPRLAVIEQLAIQLGGVAAFGTALALLFRRWSQCAVLALLTATLCWPVFVHRAEAAVVRDPARLKVVSANLWHAARSHERTLQVLTASDADILGLVEVTPEWRVALAPLIARYPYRVDCFDLEAACHYLLLSKLPVVKPYAGRIFKVSPIIVGAELAWNGHAITVIATHLFRPFKPSDESRWGAGDPARAAYMAEDLPVSRQAGQAGLLAKFLNRLPPDLVVMGDFNGAPWSRVQRAFRGATGLDSQAGWDLTWPSSFPWPLRLPLDHVLARGHLAVTSSKAGPRTDSDHLPVFAEIGWRE
jgi:endonuclease/exonuclease/phosphatase (EEP) superfamily protein YafD